MQDGRVGRRYARALFGAAQKLDVVPSVEDDLNLIVGISERDASFRHFLLSPHASREQKHTLIDKVFSDRVTALTMQVLRVMLEKRRETELKSVRDEFVKLRLTFANVVKATIASAEELSPEQKNALVAKLTSTLNKTIEPEFRVDPHLIGGVKVTYDNNVLDGSVRGTLARLREVLRRDLLKQF